MPKIENNVTFSKKEVESILLEKAKDLIEKQGVKQLGSSRIKFAQPGTDEANGDATAVVYFELLGK